VNATFPKQQINYLTNLPCYTSSVLRELKLSAQPERLSNPAVENIRLGTPMAAEKSITFSLGLPSHWYGLTEAAITSLS
jgi:hypothetical protein